MKNMNEKLAVWSLCCLIALPQLAQTEEASSTEGVIYPAAVMTFQERGKGASGLGAKVEDLLFASLIVDPEIWLVERSEIEKILSEETLGLTGMVNASSAAKVGSLTGAKIIITGSVIEANKALYIVAKIIGTETSKVLGKSVKGTVDSDLGSLVKALAAQVAQTIHEEAGSLMPKIVKPEDRIKAINEALGERERPVVHVSILERHVGQATIDPAAETEFEYLCQSTGFEVLEMPIAAKKKASILIKGEGFSEFATRRGNLISVKARLEVKAVDAVTGEVIATDREVAVAVDLTEQIAGKTALQKAAGVIAERMLPKLVKR